MAVVGWLLDKSAAVRAADPVIGPQLVELAGGRAALPDGAARAPLLRTVGEGVRQRRDRCADEPGDASTPRRMCSTARLPCSATWPTTTGMWHRIPIPDLLIAVIALHHGLGVVHVDGDFDKIAEVRPLVSRRLGSGRRSSAGTAAFTAAARRELQEHLLQVHPLLHQAVHRHAGRERDVADPRRVRAGRPPAARRAACRSRRSPPRPAPAASRTGSGHATSTRAPAAAQLLQPALVDAPAGVDHDRAGRRPARPRRAGGSTRAPCAPAGRTPAGTRAARRCPRGPGRWPARPARAPAGRRAARWPAPAAASCPATSRRPPRPAASASPTSSRTSSTRRPAPRARRRHTRRCARPLRAGWKPCASSTAPTTRPGASSSAHARAVDPRLPGRRRRRGRGSSAASWSCPSRSARGSP